MKQDIENIIKKNLPEKVDDDGFAQDPSVAFNNGFDEALSQIDTKLIADEVLKVVVEVANNLHDNFEKQDYSDAEYKANFLSELRLQLLSEHLSPNKENE